MLNFFIFTSFLITVGQSIISPVFFENGKDKIFVGLFLFLYFLFISLEVFSSIRAIDKEYFLPKMSFFIFRNGKEGSLPLALFIRENSPCMFLFGYHFAQFLEFLYFFSAAHSLESAFLYFKF